MLLAGLLVAGVLLYHSVSAAHAQSQPQNTVKMLTQSDTMPRLETFIVIEGNVAHRSSDDGGATWSSWVNLPPATPPLSFVGTPAVVSDGVARLNVLVQDGFYHATWIDTYNDGSWSGWNLLSGIDAASSYTSDGGLVGGSLVFPLNDVEETFELFSGPAVASWGSGHMDAFVYGRNNIRGTIALLHTWADNYTWSGDWEVLGTGLLQGNPAAVSWGPGRIDVFVRGGANEPAHKYFANGQWSSGWDYLDGALLDSPAVASWGPGRLDLFVRGTDSVPYHKWYSDATGWSGWESMTGATSFAPAVASLGPNLLDLYVIGTDHNYNLYHQSFNGSQWSGWQGEDLSTTLPNATSIDSGPAAVVWTPSAPVQDPPTLTPSPNCGRAGQPPCPRPN